MRRGVISFNVSEIEERNKELLEKINEGRLNKIEKVEVYKPDEFDEIPESQKEEKTKGQEFAEHLKRQFAALNDEDISTEELMAIQDFENSKVEEVDIEYDSVEYTRKAGNCFIEEIESSEHEDDEEDEAVVKNKTLDEVDSNIEENGFGSTEVEKSGIPEMNLEDNHELIKEIIKDLFENVFSISAEENCSVDAIENDIESRIDDQDRNDISNQGVALDDHESQEDECRFYDDCTCMIESDDDADRQRNNQ